jgi:hypothetical protein
MRLKFEQDALSAACSLTNYIHLRSAVQSANQRAERCRLIHVHTKLPHPHTSVHYAQLGLANAYLPAVGRAHGCVFNEGVPARGRGHASLSGFGCRLLAQPPLTVNRALQALGT